MIERGFLIGALATSVAIPAAAQDTSDDLAKKLVNPVADLVSVPLQGNYDHNIGPAKKGDRWTLNIQPVIPIGLNADWNLISRTILPVTSQNEIFPGAGSQDGIGDVLQSLFFSPKKPTAGGWIWGAGPAFLLPTGSDELLTADKWGVGPTGVALKQTGPWTYGMLANHIWSVAGKKDRADISSTFVQPFVSYITATKTTFTVNSESTYDWKNRQWSVPINLVVSQLLVVGHQPISIFAGARYWAETPQSGPHNWGLRVGITFLFPK